MSIEEIGLPVAVAAGVWGAFSEVMKIVEMLNQRRDLVLNVVAEGERLTPPQRRMLFQSDWIPIWIGLQIFLLIFTAAFAYVWWTVDQAQILTGLAAGLGVFAMIVQVATGVHEGQMMVAFIRDKEKQG